MAGMETKSRTFQFRVFGEPKPQARPRAFARKIGSTYTARVYNPATAEAWKSQIAISARDSGLDGAMLQQWVCLEMHCAFQRPKSHYRSGKHSDLLKFAHENSRKTSKPDCDNLLKSALDAFSAIGAWRDDAQLVHIVVSKEWTTSASHTDFHIVGC